jgi:hypothetical protein
MSAASAPPDKWSRLPIEWIRKGTLRKFRGGSSLGKSVAALKILMTVILKAENRSSASAGANQGSASLSYDELCEFADLSRPMVAAGLEMLKSEGILFAKREGKGGKGRYFLTDYKSADPWGKVPNRKLYREPSSTRIAALYDFSCRRQTDLNALKLYFLLCAFVDGKAQLATIGYPKISEYSGIPEAKIRQAISHLIESRLIYVHVGKRDDRTNAPNRYEILGLNSAFKRSSKQPLLTGPVTGLALTQ